MIAILPAFPRSIARIASAALPLLLIAGCGSSPPGAQNYNSAAARQTLVTALDAWRDKQLPQLTRLSPPIHFTDDDLVQGLTLVSYQLDPAVTIAPHQDVIVVLELQDRQGTTLTRKAAYQVTLEPNLAVLRNDP